MPELPRGIAIDLELDAGGRLALVGACGIAEADDDGDPFVREPRGGAAATDAALRQLDDFVGDAPFWCGHNVLWHDRPWLADRAEPLRLLRKPVVDTLVLSTLAFAEHPYHALVKDYKLASGSRNDPVADSRLSARLLRDAVRRLRELTAPARSSAGRCTRWRCKACRRSAPKPARAWRS